MHASGWQSVTAAVHQLGYLESASAEAVHFRTGAVRIDLRHEPGGPHAGELHAFADLGAVDEALRECCFGALLSVNLNLFRGGRSTVGISEDDRIIFASRMPFPEGISYAEFLQELQEFCSCVEGMHRDIADFTGREEAGSLLVQHVEAQT